MAEKLASRALRGLMMLACATLGALFAVAGVSAEPGVSKDTIRIGMFGPLTGPVAMYGYPINNGAIAIYKKINDEGGINGREVEIFHEDGACDPAKTRAAVKKLIAREDVFMIHGGNCSAAVFAAREEFIDNQVPFMVMAATQDSISTPVNRYIFTTTLTGTDDGGIMLRFVNSMPNVKRIAIVRHPDEWADSRMKALAAGVKDSTLEVAANEVLERKASDATAQVLKLKEAKPDVVLMFLYPAEAAVFLRDARKYGLAGPVVGAFSVSDLLDLAERAGGLDMVKDVYATSYLAGPIGSPAMSEFTNIYRKYFPNDKLSSSSFSGMSSAYAVIDALRRAGPDLTREKFIDALEATREAFAGPAYCKISFSKSDHRGCKNGQVWTVRNGQIVALGPTWSAAGQ